VPRALVGLLGVAIVATVLWDAFETVVLPRSVTRRLRLTRTYTRVTWRTWTRTARAIRRDAPRERFLGIYGPLALFGLTAVWALGLSVGFASLAWSFAAGVRPGVGPATFGEDLYASATTLFGLGETIPVGRAARILTVAEAGAGFGVLAIVIAYLPVLYQSFSRREVQLTLMDAWAGSPPSAGQVLRRLAEARAIDALDTFLRDWERWSSDILESHISYPIVAFFRSQHQRQSWVSALTTVLDVSAFVVAGIKDVPTWQARMTFAIARHAAVDLTQVLHAAPTSGEDRLPPAGLESMRRALEAAGLEPDRSAEADRRLIELRRSYEPYVLGLARALLMPASSWWPAAPAKDNWQTSPRAGGAHF
jgi:hypothetical protein